MKEQDIEFILKKENLFMKLEIDGLETWIPVETAEEIHKIDVSNLVGGLKQIYKELNSFLLEKEEKGWIYP